MTGGKAAWIGGYKTHGYGYYHNRRTFTWLDNTEWNYTNWENQEPNQSSYFSSDDTYVKMNVDGSWETVNRWNSHTIGYLCKKSLDAEVLGNVGCLADNGKPCVFPFVFDSKIYTYCPNDLYVNNIDNEAPWCSTKTKWGNKHVSGEGEWGYCNYACPLSSSEH